RASALRGERGGRDDVRDEDLRFLPGADRPEAELGAAILWARGIQELLPPRAERGGEEETHAGLHPSVGPGGGHTGRTDGRSGRDSEGEALGDNQDAEAHGKDADHRLSL